MKDYHEMTQSVLQQAKARAAQRTHQRRMATGLIAAAFCLAILISVVSVGMNRNPADATQPTISVENPTTVPATQPEETEPTQQENEPEGVKVTFLSSNNGEETEVPLEVGIETPIDYIVYVRDLKGLDDEKRKETHEQWREFEEGMKGGGRGFMSTSFVGQEMIIGTYMKGFIGITSGHSKIKNISVDTTNEGVGNHGCGHQGEDFHVNWFINPQILIENRSIPLSSISDSLEVTVTYKDGTTEIIIIDITLNDEGQVFVTLAEDPAIA